MGLKRVRPVRTVMAVEMNSMACKIYEILNGVKPVCKKIEEVSDEEIPKADILTGGFPCQSFSNAGLRAGMKDKRTKGISHIFRFIRVADPRHVILENVPAVMGFPVFKRILAQLRKMGYNVAHAVLGTHTHAGLRQKRKRVFIVASKGAIANFPPPEVKSLAKFDFAKTAPEKYYLAPGTRMYDVMQVATPGSFWQANYSFEPKNSDVAFTQRASQGPHKGARLYVRDRKGVRWLTEEETFELQGIPTRRLDKLKAEVGMQTIFKAVGNSVSPKLVGIVAKSFDSK